MVINEKNIREITAIPYDSRPNVLLVGNGLSIPFGADSWENLIKGFLKKYKSPYRYEEIKDLNATVQVVLATNDQVGLAMGEIATTLRNNEVGETQRKFIQKMLDVPVDAILNTNYDYDLEQGLGLPKSIREYQKCRRWTKKVTGTEKQFNLFQYSNVDLKGEQKRIWHIHGDVCVKDSMVMGQYYYGKLLYQIEKYISEMMRVYKTSVRKKVDYTPKSWVDYFLLGDVYVIGFAMYLSELDLWWLICCKKILFPDTHIYFYEDASKLSADRKMLMKVYNIIHMDHISFDPKADNEYLKLYTDSIEDIKKRILKDK